MKLIRKKIFSFLVFVFTLQANCNPGTTNNICDPKSKSFESDMILSALANIKTSYCGINFFISPPTISNLKDKGTIETGFIFGTAIVGTRIVQVSIDGGTFQNADGTITWKFKLPFGSATWKDESIHTVSVRADDGIATSKAVSISVKKGINKDVNGDGFADLVASAQTYNTNTGRVYIYYSKGSSGIASGSALLADKIFNGETTGNQFGLGLATGDINGDGFADLVVSASQFNTAQGRVYIFHSSGSSGITNSNTLSAETILTGETVGDNFGTIVSTGDMNGDGFADLVTGGYAYNASQGRAYIFHSSGSTGVQTNNASNASFKITGEAGVTSFGVHTIAGDINGDGYSDLVVGASTYNSNQGRAYVFHSSGSSGVQIANAISASTIISSENTSSTFGISAVAADINGDGFSDVAIGGHNFNSNQGRTYIFHSSGKSGLGSNVSATGATTILTGEAVLDQFGRFISSGDMNSDGFSDLLVSSIGYNGGVDMGRTYIFQSSGSAGIVSIIPSFTKTVITGEIATGRFGKSLPADINGDGYPDLLVSSNQYNSNQGRVYIFNSSPDGVSASNALSAATILTGEAGTGTFGSWIAMNFDWKNIFPFFRAGEYL